MDVLPPAESTHALRPYTFAFFINVSKHPVYSQLEKCMLTRSEYPSLNPPPVAVECVKMEQVKEEM